MIVALCGNQNAGKTTLFNLLTGAAEHVGNYPGVTVEQRVGRLLPTYQQGANAVHAAWRILPGGACLFIGNCKISCGFSCICAHVMLYCIVESSIKGEHYEFSGNYCG